MPHDGRSEGSPEVIPGAEGGDEIRKRVDAERLAEIVDVIVALASKDFSRRAEVGDGGHVLDAIATGLNMLAEEAGKQHRVEQEYRRHVAHSDRLAAAGQLAASVAHEINNPAAFVLANLTSIEDRLSAVESFVDEARRSFAEGSDAGRRIAEIAARSGVDDALPEIRKSLSDSVSGVQRVVAIVRDLRGFTRAETGRIELVPLGELIDDACKLAAHEILYRARLVKDIQPAPRVRVDRVKLAQVVTNLLLNAAQAIPEGDREAHRVEVSAGHVEQRVFIRVADTGQGIPPDVQARLFEPFFTTKPGDRGMGLGLAVSDEIVRRHQGELRFESTPGRGTVFEIWLPAEVGGPRTPPPPPPPPPAPAATTALPRVLIIDDEEELLVAYGRVLRKHLDLTVAGGGRAALAILEKDARWDAILCDIMMPDLDGPSVLEWVSEHRPEIAGRLGFCTGGAFTPRTRTFAEHVTGRLFEKPLSRAQILAAVERLRPKPLS